MRRRPTRSFEQALIALIAISACLTMLQNVLPRLVPSIVVVGLVIVVVRIVFDRTRPW